MWAEVKGQASVARRLSVTGVEEAGRESLPGKKDELGTRAGRSQSRDVPLGAGHQRGETETLHQASLIPWGAF